MRFGLRSLSGLLVAGAAMLVALGTAQPASATPVQVNLTNLRTIQTFNLDKKGNDDVYLLVTGAAKGQPINERLPQGKTWSGNTKEQAVSEKQPVTVWKGDLGNGEFALITVTLMQGKGTDEAKIKEYLGKITDAEKDAAGKKTLASADDFKNVAKDTLKNERAVITKIKDIFSREKKTDHYGGLFNVLVWNNNGKIVKRLDPVGLTFGEHNGTDVKIYTKLKNTRSNVMVADPNKPGEFAQQSLAPLSDDQATIRVKMLETEYTEEAGRKVRNVTDYLADIQVLDNGKPVKWNLEGDNPGADEIHEYWDWAS